MRTLLLLQLALLLAPASGVTCPEVQGEVHLDGYQPRMLIGIGAQKCGSGFIYQTLKSHPQIITPVKKELHALHSQEFPNPQQAYENYLKNWDTLDNLKHFKNDHVLMEFTPDYLKSSVLPCHMKHFFPDAKFLVTLRDPVYRALSALNMSRNKCYKEREEGIICLKHFMDRPRSIGGLSPSKFPTCAELMGDVVPMLKEAQELLLNNSQCLEAFSEDPWVDCPHSELFVVGRSLYAPQISRWLKLFDASQFLFINAREFFEDPEAQKKKIAKFAGLTGEWPADTPGQHANELLFLDENLNEIIQLLENMLNETHKDLYKLFEDNRIDFATLPREYYDSNRTAIKTSEVLSYCAKENSAADKQVRTVVKYAEDPLPHGNQFWYRWTWIYPGFGFLLFSILLCFKISKP